MNCYPGSHPEYNKQTQRIDCACNPGLVWNATMTACIKPAKPEQVQVQCYPGSHAQYNNATKRTECFCDDGLVWNAERNGCVYPSKPVTPTRSEQTTKPVTKPKPGNNRETWSLASVRMEPETPNSNWKVVKEGTAEFKIYNGDANVFTWQLPNGFGAGPFNVSVGVTSSLGPMSKISSSNIGAFAKNGAVSLTPSSETTAATSLPGTPSGGKVIQFSPQPGAQEVEIMISMQWGELKVYFKYRKN